MGLQFKALYSTYFAKQHFIYSLLQNMNLWELRDQWRHSETSKNDWIRLCASISEETKTAHIVSTKNST